MPCDVRAYRRFSILRLQFRHRKQLAQNAWSSVRIARFSILFPQTLQLWMQLLQMSDLSPRRSRLAFQSSNTPQVLHRKQSTCHLLPALKYLALTNSRPLTCEVRVSEDPTVTHPVRMLCLLREAGSDYWSASQILRHVSNRYGVVPRRSPYMDILHPPPRHHVVTGPSSPKSRW